MTNTDLVHVPYKGIGRGDGGFAGRADSVLYRPRGGAPAVHQYGQIGLLAVTGEQRSRDLPDVPSISEVVPGYVADFWYGLGAPAGTPKAIIAALNEETRTHPQAARAAETVADF